MAKKGRVTAYGAIYTAILSALGDVLTLFPIPTVPPWSVTMYMFPPILIASTLGPFYGAIGGFIASLYTIVLYGNVFNVPYTIILGILTGILCTKVGLRPFIVSLLLLIFGIPWSALFCIVYGWPLFPWWIPVALIWQVTSNPASGILTEILLASKTFRKYVPKTRISGPQWVLSRKWLRNPMYEEPTLP